MRLLFDLGNTRWKWLVERDGIYGELSSCAPGDWTSLRAALKTMTKVDEIAVSSVAGDGVNEELVRALGDLFNVRPVLARVQKRYRDLQVAYRHIENLGVDRWLAMLAVRDQVKSDFVVIQAGSAITLDYVQRDGVHLGGLIVPGVDLMRKALFHKTAGVKVDALTLPQNWRPGCDTIPCVANGLSAMLRGFFEQALQDDADDLKVVISGGDAAAIDSLIALELELRPFLVFDGLRLV